MLTRAQTASSRQREKEDERGSRPTGSRCSVHEVTLAFGFPMSAIVVSLFSRPPQGAEQELPRIAAEMANAATKQNHGYNG